MPFLRVLRDKRGFETTYVMHWFRDGNRQYSRILYISQSPSSIRVGRPSLDPEVLRDLEDAYPGVEFDWKFLIDHRQVIEPPPEDRRPRRRRKDEGESGVPVALAPRAEGRVRAAEAAAAPAEARLVVPANLEGETPEEKVAFLAHWHAVLTERIPRRTPEPARRDALLALAARLNPADWTNPDDVTAGLAQAVDALERLSHVFAKRRRRTRKPAKRLDGADAAAAASSLPADAADAADLADLVDAAGAAPAETSDPSAASAASADDPAGAE